MLALPLVPLCLILVIWGVGGVVEGLARRRRVVLSLALAAGAFGVGMYLLGALGTALSMNDADHGTDSSPAPACRDAGRGTVAEHRAGFLPLRFDCVLEDGTTFSVGVPRWYTPVAFGLAAAGVGLAVSEWRRSPDRAVAAPATR
jgi:hypothetical protein